MSDLLTPQDVRDERFDEHWFHGGYDTVQVDDFMQRAEHTIDALSRRVTAFGAKHDDYKTALVWLDIETTGLEIGSDEVLEVGVVVTTADPFKELLLRHWLVRPLNWRMKKAMLVDEVRSMHEANGLIAALDAGEGIRLDGVLWELDALLDTLATSRKLYLAGNSVGFDRRFLENFEPDLFHSLSHRIVDVSSLDVIYGAMAPDSMPRSTAPHTHRVMDCLDSSRLVYAAYLEQMFGKEAK
jgi:oligoribonuclease